MKDCCKTGDEEPQNSWNKWLRYGIISAVVVAILLVLINQLNS